MAEQEWIGILDGMLDRFWGARVSLKNICMAPKGQKPKL